MVTTHDDDEREQQQARDALDERWRALIGLMPPSELVRRSDPHPSQEQPASAWICGALGSGKTYRKATRC